MISDIKPKQGDVEVIAEITELNEPREFSKFGKAGRVCSGKIKDESGMCQLTLWNEQIDMFKVGDKIHLKNGYANEWQGELQLTTGRNGSIEKVE